MSFFLLFAALCVSVDAAPPTREVLDAVTNNTRFLLFTRTNPSETSEIIPNDDLTLGNYNPENDNKILIHGYTGNANTTWMNDMKDAFLTTEDANVVIVDWGPLAGGLYPNAVANTRPVGEYVAALITYLLSVGSTLENTHILGKSLGAQAASFTGASLGGQVARITGLDPGGPMFENVGDEGRLDPSDAQFVDVIHTNSGELSEGAFGVTFNSGHIDFWPNGGSRQPGCYDPFESIPDISTGCSHDRSTEFYVESIYNKNAFLGYPCSNYTDYSAGECILCGSDGCPHMGYGTIVGQPGTYYLATRISEPFTGKHVFVDLVISENQQPATGHIFLTLNSSLGSDKEEVLIEGGKNSIQPGAYFNSVIAVFNNLLNFNGGTVEFDQEGTELQTDLIIDSIQVWDPETNQRICTAGNTTVPDGGTTTITLINC